MKWLFVAGAIVCMGLFAGSGYTQSATSPAQQQIEAVMDGMARAAHAHDADRFTAGYRHGSELVFVIDGRVIHGWNALHAQQLKWWRNGKSDVVYTKSAQTKFMQLAPDVWVTTETLSSRRTGADGKPVVGSFAVTSIWRKYAGGWRIVYSHESWAKPSG